MTSDEHNSTRTHNSLATPRCSVDQVNILRGYIHPSDSLLAAFAVGLTD
ncbi:MAG: hypothetical protein QOJ88_481 [Pyrinomonadaceae bacterium]|jgi:hypothetical protein|nr:hypothetical protein [Pyrinomonadaceae bacterium]